MYASISLKQRIWSAGNVITEYFEKIKIDKYTYQVSMFSFKQVLSFAFKGVQTNINHSREYIHDILKYLSTPLTAVGGKTY